MDEIAQIIDAILRDVGAKLTDGHFVLTSWRHSSGYIDPEALYNNEAALDEVCGLIAQRLKVRPIDFVLGPAAGANALAQGVAEHLIRLTRRGVNFVRTVKTDDGGQAIDPEFVHRIFGMPGYIVDDVTTTGESIEKLAVAVHNHGGHVIGAHVLVNRNPAQVGPHTFESYPFTSEIDQQLDVYELGECPICEADVVPVDPNHGHGREFLEKRRQAT